MKLPLSVTKGLPSRAREDRSVPSLPSSAAGGDAKGDDFHRQHAASAEAVHQLLFTYEDDQSARSRGHDLLAQQRPTKTLNQVELRIDLVGPVHSQVDGLHVVQRDQWDVQALGECGGGLRSRHAAYLQSGLHAAAKGLDKRGRGRPVPKPTTILGWINATARSARESVAGAMMGAV